MHFFFIQKHTNLFYLPIRLLVRKTQRIAPRASCLRLKPFREWRAAAAARRRTSWMRRAGTLRPPTHTLPPHDGCMLTADFHVLIEWTKCHWSYSKTWAQAGGGEVKGCGKSTNNSCQNNSDLMFRLLNRRYSSLFIVYLKPYFSDIIAEWGLAFFSMPTLKV